jgi:glycosyltransferase involved in cell wall biosynthesis
MTDEKPTIALIQRYVPHYSLPFYRKLVTSSKYNWEFLYGPHPGGGESGLETSGYDALLSHPIRNLKMGRVIWQRDVVRWFRERRYKAVVFELGWQIMSNAILPLIAHQHGMAAIPWSKGIAENGEPRPAWRRLVERVFIRQCQALIAYGQVSADYFVDLGYPGQQIFIAQNTVDVKQIVRDIPTSQMKAVELRKRLRLDERIVAGYLGRLVPEKKVELIIEAFAWAREHGFNGQLVIAGEGPQHQALESMARACSASDCIHFSGRIPEDEQNAYFQLFDVYISAYSAGLAILEVMASGKIVLITPEARPETELIENGVTGFVTKDFSIRSLAEGLLRAASDPVGNQHIGRRAQEVVLSRATIEDMVGMFDRAVDYALARKSLS